MELRCRKDHGAIAHKILSPLVILSREKTMVAKVISELKSVSGLFKDFSRDWPQKGVKNITLATIDNLQLKITSEHKL